MAAKKKKKKPEHSTGVALRVNDDGKKARLKGGVPAATGPNILSPETQKKAGNQPSPALSVPSPAPKQIDNNKTRPLPSPPKKAAPPSMHPRHAWAPPQLPFAREIPSLYNETYLRMIPRGPHHVFSFWELGPKDFEKVKELGEIGAEDTPQPVLRLYALGPDKGKKAGRQVLAVGDIVVPPGIHSHYVRVPEGGRTYRMELGVVTSSGGFIPMCQSNEAAVPRARVQTVSGSGALDSPGITAGRTQTGKLIDFSLLSGKMVGEAGLVPPLVFIDDDEPLAVAPGSDLAPGAGSGQEGSNVSSWNGWPAVSQAGNQVP